MIEINLFSGHQAFYQSTLTQIQGLVHSGTSPFHPQTFIQQVHAFRERLLEGGQHPVYGLLRLFSRFDDLHSDSELTPDHAQSLLDQMRVAPVPSLVPGYETMELLGAGGFSRVYRGIEGQTGRNVAIKVAARGKLPGHSDSPSGMEQLQRAFDNEWNMLRRFQGSDSIIQAHAQGVTDRGKPYIVMEHAEGGTLSQFFGAVNGGLMAFDLDVMLPTLIEAARAVAEMHAVGLIHRDIKASNFLLTGDGRVKLADLAMASNVADALLKGANERRGTPGFIAPQTTASLRNDVFALGTVFYKALTGEAPYSDKVLKLMKASPLLVIGQKARKPSEVVPERNLPKRFDGILQRAVTMDAAKRYPDAGELAADLEKITRKRPRKRTI